MIDINEVKISGIINNIMDDNKEYIKFGLTTTKKDNLKAYISLNINRNLYENNKDFFIRGNKVYTKGYLNSYIKNNKNNNFITVYEINDYKQDYIHSNNKIEYDLDKIEIWNGKRCEAIPPTENELKEMEDLLTEYGYKRKV